MEQYRNITRNELEEKLNQLVSDGWNLFQIIVDSDEEQKILVGKNPDLQTESASSEKMATKSHIDSGERPGNNGIYRLKSEKKHPKCPQCGSGDIIPIYYGFPEVSIMIKADEGKVRLGGCEPKQSQWFCKRCDKSFKEE